MTWLNVRLIFQREVRDQLRDRRTLFTITILPLVLYPLLGMSFLQIMQFMREHPTKIRVIGTDALPSEPRLIENQRFALNWCSEEESRLMELRVEGSATGEDDIPSLTRAAQRDIHSGKYDALVYFPPNFGDTLTRFRDEVHRSREDAASNTDRPRESSQEAASKGQADTPSKKAAESPGIVKVPEPLILTNQATDKSKIAAQRVERVLRRWREAVVQLTLRQNNIPMIATEPFAMRDIDVSEDHSRRAAIWSKVLPFVVLIWALTGAFYPAIDLCAGEKERGTLETLLSSPALRSEIVLGKLLTTMLFSVATSLLNVASMTMTATLFIHQLEHDGLASSQYGVPPLSSLGWLVVALIPVSALFSALSLAVASFARSSKEGQYYLMPLLLITLPLMILPLLPTAELNIGTSLIPVTGAMLLLRSLIEGQYAEAAIFAPAVIAVTSGCCLLAFRWAVDQFNNESVLFRESERWDLGLLLQRVVRDRQDTPTFGQSLLCGILLLLLRFFVTLVGGPMPTSWNAFATTTVVSLFAFFAFPALLMSLLMTRSARTTLQLQLPHPLALPVAVLLAITLHPAGVAMAHVIQQVYQFNDQLKLQLEQFSSVIQQAPSLAAVLAVMALTPAICEELAFRGYVLSGLRRSGRKWTAILISSALFGAAHHILQQSISAFLLGLVIGYLAIQTGSIFSAMLFHLTYNSLSLLLSLGVPAWREQWPVLDKIVNLENGEPSYQPAVLVVGLIFSAAFIVWLHRLPYPKSDEEEFRATSDGLA